MSQRAKILVADDEPTFRQSMADLLRREGFDCETAADGPSAAAMLNISQFDLMIADIKMPGNPELELIRHLPAIAEGMPVILVTGYPDMRSAVDSAVLPVLAYLVKPVDFSEVLRHTRRAVEQSALQRAARTIRGRVQAWQSELESAIHLTTQSARAGGLPASAFFSMNMRHVLSCLAEMNDLPSGAIEDQSNQAITSAVRQIIELLEQADRAAGNEGGSSGRPNSSAGPSC